MRFWLKLFVLVAAACVSSWGAVDFQRDVRPILSATCFKCHGPDEETRKGKLRLDVREEALKSLAPGNPEESEVLKRVLTTDEDDLMPPPKSKMPLTEKQKEILKQWVAEGADYKPHWAFEAPRASLPEVKNSAWVRNEIDRFILARLEKEGLKPSERADRATLARRVYLDLIGLPPTPEEARAFVEDTSENAFEKLVDRLLESPHYGERWARRWLDLARYADTNGYEKDRPRSMWPYRDWVINALNADMPFDQFTIEQLAGDMLPGATQDQIIATGFHRNSMINEEGGADPLEFRFHAMVDRVHVTATTWLGLTMACAQCHTHKYDPIQHKDYYSFMAFMNNVDEIPMDVVKADIAEKRRAAEAKIAEMEAALLEKFPAPSNIEWRTPGEVEIAAKGQGELLKDGSIRVSGENPNTDTYILKFKTSAARVTHLRLEAIPDSGAGPGRTDHGNFVVSEIELKAGDAKAKFAAAEADFSQDGFAPEQTYDGKANTGWAIATGGGAELRQYRRMILTLAEPLAVAKDSEITVRLAQEYGGKHTLGRFRVSLGEDLSFAANDAEKSRKHRDAKFAKWIESESAKAVSWTSLAPSSVVADNPTLDIEADNVIFASGDFTKNDNYTVTFKNVPAGVKALRIEALPDSRLPANGPGRVHYEGSAGDFFLSNMKVSADGKALAFKNPSQSFAAGGNTADKVIDADLQSGWSANGGQGRAHSAVFQLTEPLAGAGELKMELTMERYYASALGKFRVWVTTDENATASALPNEAMEILARRKNELSADERKVLLAAFAQVAPELAAARKEIEKARNEMPKFPTTLVMKERGENHPRATKIHHRGEFLQPKDEVSAAIPSFLGAWPEGAPTNRLGFAKWLVSGKNPLTGRVVMNRHWEAFFGRGLVRTMEDFGLQGDLPTHPELLDWLAIEFVKRGWSQKKMHKLIVMSAAYQQSSRVTPELLEKDPNNVLLARGPRFRVEAEAVRDAALVASGLFSPKLGGPSVFPPQPPGVTTEGAYGPLQWKVSEGPDRYRRSLYTFAKRTAPFAMTATFDGPSGEACLARRDRSNTPLQALTLLNDEIFMESARALGKWASAQEGDSRAVIEKLFQRVVTRAPSETEKGKLAAFLESQIERFEKGDLKAEEFLGENSDGAAKRAAWTALARVLLNLDETVTKS